MEMKLLILFLLSSILALTIAQSSFLLNENSAIPSSSSKTRHLSSHLPINAVEPFPANPTYASLIEYSDASCLNVISIETTLLNVCMGNAQRSVKYSCGKETLDFNTFVALVNNPFAFFDVYPFKENGIEKQLVYNDRTCGIISSSQQTVNGSNCVAMGGSYYEVNCNVANAYDFPKGNYVIETIYQTKTCNAEILRTNAVNNEHCYDWHDGSSSMYSWPNEMMYSNSNCTGLKEQYDLSQIACSYDGGDDDDYIGVHVYQSFSNVARR